MRRLCNEAQTRKRGKSMKIFDFEKPNNWTVVTGSSNITAIQYTAGDPAADFGILRIRFTSGEEYTYAKVPNQLAVDFFEAESKGRFFHANIKPNFVAVRNSNEQDALEDNEQTTMPV